MTSNRPYRRAMSHTDALAELTRHAATQFDPEVADTLVRYLYGRRQKGWATIRATSDGRSDRDRALPSPSGS
jgi:HD-GYP domain-containing protein (c-di-GMP phosphodiesterase class II)